MSSSSRVLVVVNCCYSAIFRSLHHAVRLCLLDTNARGNHLVATVGLAIGTVCSSVLETVDTLWSRGGVDSALLVSTLSTQSVGRSAVLCIVVDDRLAGNVLGLDLALGRVGVSGVTSVAGVDKSLETGTLTRVLLHDLLVLTEGLGHLVMADVVQELALAERSWDGGTELAVTSL